MTTNTTIPEGAIKVFKFVTEDFKSPAGYGTRVIDYSGPYPKTIIEPDCDPPEKGQCGKGIHVVPMVDNIDWKNVPSIVNVVAGYVMSEDVVFSENNGKMRVNQFTVTHIPERAEIIPFILQKAWTAYDYAYYIDKASSDDTRKAACTNSSCAFSYALDIDRQPRNDTRKAACKGCADAYDYANFVDKTPRDDTRRAACKGSYSALNYAREVDKGPRDDTRKAACKEPHTARYYARDVDRGPRDDTRKAACRNPQVAEVYAFSVDKGPRDDTRKAACKESKSACTYAQNIDCAPHPETWNAVQGSEWVHAYLAVFLTTAEELNFKFAKKKPAGVKQ